MMPDTSRNVPLAPLFSPHVEAKAMEALNVLIVVHGGDGSPVREDQLHELRTTLTRLVDCLFPPTGDAADFAGPDSLEGNDYIHPIKVASLAVVIGRAMGMPRSALIHLAMSASLMNIGYLTLRRSVLNEPRRLVDGEWEQHVHLHPAQGVALLGDSGLPEECLCAVREHHERWDGSGYPRGLAGDAICRNARILAVADTFVSLRSLRPYRLALSQEDALREVVEGGGRLFDPEVVDVFQEVVARYSPARRARTDARLPLVAGTAAGEEHAPARGRSDWREDPAQTAHVTRDREGDGDDHPWADARQPRDRGRDDPLRTDVRRAAPAAVERAARADVLRAGQRARPPVQAAAPARASRPARPRRRQRAAPRRRPRHERATLFAVRLYVDAALRGGWTA